MKHPGRWYMLPLVKLVGDEAGIAALKAIHKKNPGAMKALIDDARTTTDRSTYFTAEDGTKYKLRLDPATGNFVIEPSRGTMPPPG